MAGETPQYYNLLVNRYQHPTSFRTHYTGILSQCQIHFGQQKEKNLRKRKKRKNCGKEKWEMSDAVTFEEVKLLMSKEFWMQHFLCLCKRANMIISPRKLWVVGRMCVHVDRLKALVYQPANRHCSCMSIYLCTCAWTSARTYFTRLQASRYTCIHIPRQLC